MEDGFRNLLSNLFRFTSSKNVRNITKMPHVRTAKHSGPGLLDWSQGHGTFHRQWWQEYKANVMALQWQWLLGSGMELHGWPRGSGIKLHRWHLWWLTGSGMELPGWLLGSGMELHGWLMGSGMELHGWPSWPGMELHGWPSWPGMELHGWPSWPGMELHGWPKGSVTDLRGLEDCFFQATM